MDDSCTIPGHRPCGLDRADRVRNSRPVAKRSTSGERGALHVMGNRNAQMARGRRRRIGRRHACGRGERSDRSVRERQLQRAQLPRVQQRAQPERQRVQRQGVVGQRAQRPVAAVRRRVLPRQLRDAGARRLSVAARHGHERQGVRRSASSDGRRTAAAAGAAAIRTTATAATTTATPTTATTTRAATGAPGPAPCCSRVTTSRARRSW